MGAFHQMGSKSENLLAEEGLGRFCGAIISPVDYDEAQVARQVTRFQTPDFECIFDPQLYFPNTYRPLLREWSYFPADVDTADTTSRDWWDRISAGVSAAACRVGARSSCSPAIVPRSYTLDYLRAMVEVGDRFAGLARQLGLDPVQTAIVSLDAVAMPAGAMEAASILFQSSCPRVLLIFTGDLEPRREIGDVDQLTGALRLVRELTAAGVETIVSYCSTDVILYKAAGAQHVASGKFFNLRRFTTSRFEEPSVGGRQLPYFVEEGLLTLLREPDLLRLRRAGIALSDATERNPYSADVLGTVESGTGRAWLGLAWRQYLAWFADIESRITDPLQADRLIEAAELGWARLGTIRPRVLMTEPLNDGSWLRPWRISLSELLS